MSDELQETPTQAPGLAHEQETEAAEGGLTIARFPEKLALVKFGPGADVPGWAESSSIFSVTATATETAVVCAGRNVPTKARGIKPLTGFSIPGPVDFADGAAVLLALLGPLVEEGIAATTAGTVESRWVLVPSEDANRAEAAWRRRGHAVAPAVPVR